MVWMFPGWKLYCEIFELPEPQTEYQFHPIRKWLLDAAWPDDKVGIEIQGGLHGGKGHFAHNTYAMRRRDIEKINAAQVLGWVILQFEWKDIKSGAAIPVIRQAIIARREEWNAKRKEETPEPSPVLAQLDPDAREVDPGPDRGGDHER